MSRGRKRMARNLVAGPAQMVLTAAVARRYYVDGKSKIQIAEEFNLSRFKVARLLDIARSTGLVRVEIGYPGAVDLELSDRLQDAFGLKHSIVIVTPEDVLGLAWARSVSTMAAALTRLAPTPVVQMTGALSRPDGDDASVDVVRDVARTSGGPAYFF